MASERGRLWRAVAILVLAGAAAIAAWSFATGWAPSPRRYALQGLDLGELPPPVEWPTVRAAGADFAYLVATIGADRRDPEFEPNWAALPEAGMRRGAVHLYSLCRSAADQANAFNVVVPAAADALPAAVDLSFRDDCAARPDRDVLVGEVRRFVTMVETHTGKPVLLRVSRAMEAKYRLTAAIERPVWAMAAAFPPAYAARPWRLWQATTIRRIGGIDGPVNWDVMAP